VHALDVIEQQARFTQIRCAEEGVVNVQADCGGDDCRLPYADRSVDAVLMNLVFEWCASRNRDDSPPEAQARLLRETARVLKPGGLLYLTTKNRFALKYVLGQRDEHALLLPGGNALPRWLLRVILKTTARARDPRRDERWGQGYLYSHSALRRLVYASGFSRVGMYCPVPEPRNPQRFIGADGRSVAAARRREPTLRLADGRYTGPMMKLMPASLVKYFTYGQTVLAYTAQEQSM
jgi:SAM-dependent methyltransferase